MCLVSTRWSTSSHCHRHNERRIPGRLISCFGDWPHKVTRHDGARNFFVCGYLKSRAYETKPGASDELKDARKTEISLIDENVFRRVHSNCLLSSCYEQYVLDVLFKT